MSGFLVDSRTLLAVRDKLGRLHDQLLGMHTVSWGYEGVLGGRELEGELQRFCGTWHWGILEIAGQITQMMGQLLQAAAAYQRIEDRITGASQPHSGSGTTAVGGSPSGSHGSGSAGSHGGSGTTTVGGGPTVTHPSKPPKHKQHSGGQAGSGTTVIG
jgi:hypothetical protein